MQLPIDINALLNAASDIDAAAHTPLAVSIYIDERASFDCVAHVRNAFASVSPTVRVTIQYLNENELAVNVSDDMAVIVAGTSPYLGTRVGELQRAGVPVMVVTTSPQAVKSLAEEQGTPLAAADVVAPDARVTNAAPKPEENAATQNPAGEKIASFFSQIRGAHETGEGAAARIINAATQAAATVEAPTMEEPAAVLLDSYGEPLELNEAAKDSLNWRMGNWIIDACKAKKLAFALAFPFVRRPLTADSVNLTAVQNAVIGFVAIIPGADMPIMTLNQCKMLLQISAAYGQKISMERVKELAVVVGGGFAFRAVARQLVGLVPALGWFIKAGIGYAGTQAMGRAAVEYFEGGGNFGGLARVVGTARNAALSAFSTALKTPVGRSVAKGAKRAIKRAGTAALGGKTQE